MTAEHFHATIQAMVSQRPFQPFTIELNTGQRIEIDSPGALLWNETDAAIFRSPGGPLVVFDHDSVNQIINDLARSAPGKRRSSK